MNARDRNDPGKHADLPARRSVLRMALPAMVSLFVLPGVFWPSYQYVERNDGGFRYRDFKGSPYDQIRVPDEGINQIQCPPPQRPYCGDN
ncbi:MAG: hypothetical protein VYD64_07655 [Pseudomonadota bacterium]|nr:hypothetical protein [Pseudomonadota bacterium]